MHALVHHMIFRLVGSTPCHEPCMGPTVHYSTGGRRTKVSHGFQAHACLHAPTVTAPCRGPCLPACTMHASSRLPTSHACMPAAAQVTKDGITYDINYSTTIYGYNAITVRSGSTTQAGPTHPSPLPKLPLSKAATYHHNQTSKRGYLLPPPNPPCRLLCPWSSLLACPLPMTRGPPSAATPSACTYVPTGG